LTNIEYISGTTFHNRKGKITNKFKYKVDYFLIDSKSDRSTVPRFFSFNKKNIISIFDEDHGGPPKRGKGIKWVYEILDSFGHLAETKKIYLLAQAKVLGPVFNPVSFWLCYDLNNNLNVVLVEVSNTFGEKHSYICSHPDRRPIAPTDKLNANKIFHVSPFQVVEGNYKFQFKLSEKEIHIVIDYSSGDEGVYTNLIGKKKPLSSWIILKLAFLRPLDGWRVLFLIHYQALKLWFKGAKYREKPSPPRGSISR
jgi:hypothetical protein